MALALDVRFLRQRWHKGSIFTQLLGPRQDNFRPPIIVSDVTVYFNGAAFQGSYISHMFEIAGEHNNRERADTVVLTEIQKGYSLLALFHSQNSSTHTLRGANMVASFTKGNALGDEVSGMAEDSGKKEKQTQSRANPGHTSPGARRSRLKRLYAASGALRWDTA
jgi:hypothetical protein